MKIFAVITIFAVLGGSSAFLEGVGTLFHNLGQELGDVGKDLLHTAEPVATSLLQQLEKAGTQLLTTAASDLLSHLGTTTTTTAGKRSLSEIVSKVGTFVTKGEEYFKQVSALLEGAFKGTVAKIHSEIESVKNAEKPLAKLVDEVKDAITGHNNFVNDLISKAEQEGSKLIGSVFGAIHSKRDLASFGQSLQTLLQQVSAPLKSALGDIVSKLETKVLSLLG